MLKKGSACSDERVNFTKEVVELKLDKVGTFNSGISKKNNECRIANDERLYFSCISSACISRRPLR